MTMNMLLHREGFISHTPGDIATGTEKQLAALTNTVLSSIGLDHYDATGTRRRSILRFVCQNDEFELIAPEQYQNDDYYAYGLKEQLNPLEKGRIRKFRAITHDEQGNSLLLNRYIQAHAAYLMTLAGPAKRYEFDYQFIGYFPTTAHNSVVTPPVIHWDGLDSYTLSSITTLSKCNVTGGEFIVANGDAVGTDVDEVRSADIRLMIGLPVGFGVVIDERNRNGQLPVGHGAKATRLANPDEGEGHRLIMVAEVKRSW